MDGKNEPESCCPYTRLARAGTWKRTHLLPELPKKFHEQSALFF